MNEGKLQWRDASKNTFSVIAAGDVCSREINSDWVAENAFNIMADVKSCFDAVDLRLVQWENAVIEKGIPIDKSGPNHCCRPSAINLLTTLKTDVALLANNHTGDYGPKGVSETIRHLENKGLLTVGAGVNRKEAAKPLYLDSKGFRVGILNFCEYEFGIARHNSAGTAPLDPLKNIAAIRNAKQQADVVIATIHGGHETYPYPSPRMVEWYREFAMSGADAVFACHTHCPLGYEIWNGVPIVYSPGNFYFPARPKTIKSWFLGFLPTFRFDNKGAFALEVIPYCQKKEKVTLLKDMDKKEFFRYMKTLNQVFTDSHLCEKMFDGWCMTSGLNDYLGIIGKMNEITWPPDFSDRQQIQKWLGVRNIFSCQSHNDLIRNTMLIIEERRIEEARRVNNHISTIQQPEWFEPTKF